MPRWHSVAAQRAAAVTAISGPGFDRQLVMTDGASVGRLFLVQGGYSAGTYGPTAARSCRGALCDARRFAVVNVTVLKLKGY